MYHIIPDKLSNKNLSPTVTDSYIRDRILNTSLFLLQNLILLYQKRLNYKIFCYTKICQLLYHEDSK